MSETTVTVRSSIESDVPEITEIYTQEVLHGLATFELEPPEAAEMAARRKALVDGGYPHIVAAIGGRIAGYAYAGAYRPRPAYRFSVEDSVYVAGWARRRGVGKALINELVARCERDGRRQMIAVIGDSGHEASIGVHAACGFVHAGTVRDVGYKFGQWVDVVIMQRALGPGSASPPPEGL